jgi:hypothetical protein
MTKEFFDLVIELRKLQRKINYGGNSYHIRDVNKLEKEVDRQIKALTETKGIEQNKLF